MTDREAIKIALEKCKLRFMEDAANILRQALAQLEQELVAFLFDDMTWTCQKSWTNEITGGIPVYAKLFKNYEEPVAWMDKEDCGDMTFTLVKPTYDNDLIPLYTAPPKREWVGLTDDERNRYISYMAENFAAGVLWAETKLRERNT